MGKACKVFMGHLVTTLTDALPSQPTTGSSKLGVLQIRQLRQGAPTDRSPEVSGHPGPLASVLCPPQTSASVHQRMSSMSIIVCPSSVCTLRFVLSRLQRAYCGRCHRTSVKVSWPPPSPLPSNEPATPGHQLFCFPCRARPDPIAGHAAPLR